MSNLQQAISPRVVIQMLLAVVVMPFLPLLISWRWDWWEAWVYAILYILGFAASRALAARRHPDLLALIAHLLDGQRPVLFQDMALVKPARGREKPWHQDHAYFNLAIPTPIVGVWIPFGRVVPENGCLHLLRGGHALGPMPHKKLRDWQICDGDVPTRERVAAPMEAGDVLLFDGKIPHGTPINRTDDFRWAVQYHYRPADAQEVGDEERLAAFGAEGRAVSC